MNENKELPELGLEPKVALSFKFIKMKGKIGILNRSGSPWTEM